MPHVDEGQLHAFLDHELEGGEVSALEVERHLAQCEACRAELQEVVQLRERGKALLEGNVAFPISQPVFEEVIARAGRSQTPTRGSWGPRRLVWAASIAVALGAGWLARDLLLPDAPMRTAIVSDDAISTSADPVADAGSVELSERADDEALLKGQPATIEATTRGESGASAIEAESEELALAPVAPSPPPPPPSAVASDQAAATLEELVAVGMAREGAVAAVAPAAPTAQSVVDGSSRAAFASPSGGQWAAIDRARAAEILGASPLSIENVPIVAIETATVSGAPVVRIRQNIGDGREITLTQERARVNASANRAGAPAAAESAPSSVRTERAGVVVTITGSLPANDLRALLDRLR